MNNKVAAFGQRRAGVYLLSEIYNPDDTTSSVQNINKVIPAIGSLVVDDTVGEHNTLYVVYSVDAVTHKCTLVNVAYVNGDDMEGDTKDLRMLFYNPIASPLYYPTVDTVRQTGVVYYVKDPVSEIYSEYNGALAAGTTYYERKDLHEIQIDGRISVFTSLATDYTIFHAATSGSVNGSTEVVSQYYIGEIEQSGDPTLVEDIMIPMDQIIIPDGETATDAYRPRVCYSPVPLIPGDKYLVVVRGNGHVISQFTLTGQSMSALADLNNARKTIVDMTVGGSQYNSTNNCFYITQDQELDQLAFYLDVHYLGEGGVARVAIDNVNAFMYIDEGFQTATPGSIVKVVFKYFLSHSENLGLTQAGTPNRHYAIGPTGRYISIESNLLVTETVFNRVSKIAPILCCVSSSNPYTWKILPLVYKNDGSLPELATDVDATDTAVKGFVGTTTTNEQEVTLNYYMDNNGIRSTFTNKYIVKINPLINGEADHGVYYYFRDYSTSTVIYGTDPRPKLIQTSGNQYQFSITQESGNYNIKDNFLKRYYYNANPPAPYNASNPYQPTYFRIRRIVVGSGTATIDINAAVGATNIDTFFAQEPAQQLLPSSVTLHAATGNIPATALLEFLTKNDDNTYNILYGVPVDVVRAS